MKRTVLIIALTCVLFFLLQATAFGYENKALILYDDPGAFAYSSAHQNTIANLLGHFDLPYEFKQIDQYKLGDIQNSRVTFYIGNYWDNDLPWWFMDDILTTDRPVVWLNYNLWRMAWSDYSQRFENKFGIRYLYTAPTENFNKVVFKGKTFNRQQDNFAKIQVINSSPAQVKANIINGSQTYPYIIKSNNFYFVADNPLEVWHEDQAYIPFTEVLHEMVGIIHPTSHRALVRIEDITPETDPANIKSIADYLYSQKVPFSLAVIPRFKDPLGISGPPRTVDLAEKPQLVAALKYAVSKRGTIIMHGFTHQYDSVPNPWDGMSGSDTEFYITRFDGNNPVNVGPVPEDSVEWVQNRINQGVSVFNQAGFAKPNIWETPHYLASELDHKVFAANYGAIYQRFEDAYFPFVLNRTVFGNKLIPENLGYHSSAISANRIIDRANKNLVVSCGFASFFFHPDHKLVDLKQIITGIKRQGYTFVDVNSL